MACFLYEALVLFGIGLIPGLFGAFVFSLFGNAHAGLRDAVLRVFAAVVYGVYFVGFWSRRGQTLPMQTWQIRLERPDGSLPSTGQAILRYLAAWVWIAPPALLGSALQWMPWRTLGAIGVWIALYAALARLHPQRQFWHDALCGTRLVTRRATKPR